MTADGKKGYLDLKGDAAEQIDQGRDVVMNAVVPGQPQLLVFAAPAAGGNYRDFEYDAIAASYNNSDIVKALDISAFEGNAGSFVIHSDGRVVINNTVNGQQEIYNFLAMLKKYSDLSDDEISALEKDFKDGQSGAMVVKLGEDRYYLIYEPTGIQDWTMIGIVPTAVVNAAMNRLQTMTSLIVGGISLGFAVLLFVWFFRGTRIRMKRKDKAILYRDELFSKLSVHVDDAFLLLDAATFKADYVSPNVQRLLGLSVEQIGSDVRVMKKLLAEDDAPGPWDFLSDILPGEQQEWNMEYTHQQSGERRWFHTVGLCSDVQGERKYILVLSDRTADKKASMALEEAVRSAESANKAKSTFLSNMSHDIRTPMNAIIGFSTLASANTGNEEKIKEYLSRILSAGKHLLSLINEILDMSKIESGKVDLVEEEFNLSDLVDNLLAMTSPQIEAHHHALSVNISGVTHEAVIGDSLRIQKVFTNLMSNAVKYTPDGGKIRLSITEKPSGQAKVGCYEFVFEDNGIGMEADFLDKVFEPFVRAKDDHVNHIQGTGLGMPISRNIVRMMGGDIKVESQRGVGSRFTVTMYLKLQEAQQIHYDRFVALDVLVADDDALSLESCCGMLGDFGINAEGVSSGAEAVERVVEHHAQNRDYFACILDWKMPDMDGIATTRAIRGAVGADVPIIIISAYDWSDIEQEARAAGANAFISKPLFRSRLAKTFSVLLGEEEIAQAEPLVELGDIDLTGKRALLVEDNELNAEIATEILGMTGILVERAVDGIQAVDLVTDCPDGYYDIIFMDIQMPRMNGYDAARAIRAMDRSYCRQVPIVAMTANAFAEDVHAAKTVGMNEHIAKPLDLNILAKTLIRWLL